MKSLRVMLFVILILVGCAALIIVVPGLIWDGFLRDTFFTKPPPSALNPPIYSNAQQVKIEDQGNGSKTITFQTMDNPEAVLTFYDNILRKEGWSHPLPIYGDTKNAFEWRQAGPDGPTDLAYSLKVNPTTDSGKTSGKTEVKLLLLRFNPNK